MMSNEQFEQLLGAVNELSRSIRTIASGNSDGPNGLELIGMSIAGSGTPGDSSLADAIRGGFSELSEAVRQGLQDLAEATADPELYKA